MAPGVPPGSVVVTVPRHASAAASEELLAEIKQAAESEGKRFSYDHGGASQTARSKAALQASEWNNLLISARAARGPQWDVGIQQYLVDKESNLYYDPTLLSGHETTTEEKPDESANMVSDSGTPITPVTGEQTFERRRTRAGGGGY